MAPETLDPVASDLLARLPESPDAYPQKLDIVREAVLLVRFDQVAYRAASFLDDRILGPATQGAWLPTRRVVEAASGVRAPRPVHFILHTGHVGSTLVSRLLDETGAVLSLREPLPLRMLAEAHDALNGPDSLLSDAQFDAALATFMSLWGRGYDGTHSVIVKATSSAGRVARPILSRNASARAVYMNLRAEPYLATLLAGRNSPIDLRGHGPERARRMQSRISQPLAPLHTLSIGELAALAWLAESWTQRDTVKRFADRVIALDFEDFLANVAGAMGRVLGHFGLPQDARYLASVARSPTLTRYSKAPEYAYTPDVRAEVLRDSRRDNREEIGKGLQWLDRLARSDAAVAAFMNGA
jgi:predicted nucleic acid-binding protein